MPNSDLPIIDCHQHFIDARRLQYPVFAQRSAGFEAVVGDYSALPRMYLSDDYRRDAGTLNIVKTVWAEFISNDPLGEARWAEQLAQSADLPNGMIVLIDFLSPDLHRTLDLYRTMPHVRCMRQHLAWHPTNPLLRYAARPDILSDDAWRRGLHRRWANGLKTRACGRRQVSECRGQNLRDGKHLRHPLDHPRGPPMDTTDDRDLRP